jgi:hypothetical protein
MATWLPGGQVLFRAIGSPCLSTPGTNIVSVTGATLGAISGHDSEVTQGTALFCRVSDFHRPVRRKTLRTTDSNHRQIAEKRRNWKLLMLGEPRH